MTWGHVCVQDDDEDDDEDVEEEEADLQRRKGEHRYSLRDRSRHQVQPYVPGQAERPRCSTPIHAR